jgi:predicted O-linked N-acetylglucosamine transferase (SPINDLY family)/predicted Zn-dependent protease
LAPQLSDPDKAFEALVAARATGDGIQVLSANLALVQAPAKLPKHRFQMALSFSELERFVDSDQVLANLQKEFPGNLDYARERMNNAFRWLNHRHLLTLSQTFTKRFPRRPHGHFRLSQALEALGRVEEASRVADKALSIDPEGGTAEMIDHAARLAINLAGSGANIRHHQWALRERATKGRPQAWWHLCALREQTAGPEAALALVELALREHEGHTPLIHKRSQLLLTLGRIDESADVVKVAFSRKPRDMGLMVAVAMSHIRKGQPEFAIEPLQKLTDAHPRRNTAAMLVYALTICGKVERARREVSRLISAYRNDPDSLHMLCVFWLNQKAFRPADQVRRVLEEVEPRSARSLGVGLHNAIPPVEGDVEKKLAQDRKRLQTWAAQGAVEGDAINIVPFYYYHSALFSGVAARDHCRSMALDFHKAFPDLARTYRPSLSQEPKPATRSENRRRLKIGIMSPPWMTLVDGILAKLDRDLFEVVWFVCPTPNVRVPQADFDRWRNAVDKFCIVPGSSTAEIMSAIAAEELDFFSAMAFQMPAFIAAHGCLAPVQFAWGEPAWMDGTPALDYIVSWKGAEPNPASRYYNTPVVELTHPPYWADLASESDEGLDRSAFPLPPEATWYCCAQSIWKLHPAFDDIIAEILERDSNAIFILLCGNDPGVWKLHRRLNARLGDNFNRVYNLPRLPKSHAHRLLQLVDALLDSHPIGGMSSTFAALATGAPMVTLPANLPFGGWAKACLEYIELTELIAENREEFVNKALRLAHDRDWYDALSAKVRARKALVAHNQAGVEEFSRFLISAWETSQKPKGRDVRFKKVLMWLFQSKHA